MCVQEQLPQTVMPLWVQYCVYYKMYTNTLNRACLWGEVKEGNIEDVRLVKGFFHYLLSNFFGGLAIVRSCEGWV